MQYADQPLLFAVASAAGGRTFAVQSLSILAWSFARLMFFDAPFFRRVGEAAIARSAEFGPQSLANTVWACAAIQFCNQPMLFALARAAA